MLEAAKRYSDHPDGFDELYRVALEKALSIPWGIPFVEIGTREGGSALLFLEAIRASRIPRPLITIDPYGKPYLSGPGEFLNPEDGTGVIGYPPTGEDHYRTAMVMLSSYAQEHGLIHIHYRMTSTQFMSTWDNEGLFIDGKQINTRTFGFVYLDGQHTPETVEQELTWFLLRMHKDGLIIIDDVQHIRNSKPPIIQQSFDKGKENNLRLYIPVTPTIKNNPPRYAVVTIAVGDSYEKIAKLTHPTLQAYAKKIGAEFIVIDKSFCSTPHWEKFQIYDLLNKFDRICYLDTDLIIVRKDTPNLFDLVPEDKLGAFNEAPFTPDRKSALIKACEDYNLRIKEWDGRYFNTGVLVISRSHQHLFSKPEKEIFNFYEQSYLNAIIASKNIPTFSLPYRFNRMTCLDSVTGEDRQESFIVHFAGWVNLGQTLSIIRGDLNQWRSRDFTQNGHFKPVRRHILIDVQGGLGDQIQAEPAIRWSLENIWKDADVDIKTHWPRIFQHLTNQANVFHHSEWISKPDTPYYQTCTLPGPDTSTWATVSNLLCHTVDYCSIAILKRTLPMEAKTIKLEVTSEDIAEAQNIVGEEDLKSLVLVHSGWHWSGKSFPISWWQTLVDNLQKEGFLVCLIGKQEEETRGVLPVISRPGMIDARNKTSLGGLFALIQGTGLVISNDSSPIHIAGSGDSNIILVPTTKAPDHLLPYRHGSINYKAKALFRRPMWLDFVTAPNEWLDAGVIDYIPGGEERWVDFLPDPTEVVEATKQMIGERLVEVI